MSRTYEHLVTSPDALPLSYRRFFGAKSLNLVHVTTILHIARSRISIGA